MNDGKKRRSSAELPAHKRFEKSRSRWIYPSFQNTVFVFPGVFLMYNDFHMKECVSGFQTDMDLLCIDHCREGRIEQEVGQNAFSYLEAGDLRVDRRIHHSGKVEFPLCHYHGISIGFQVETAAKEIPASMKGFSVDLYELQKKYCSDRTPYVIPGEPAIEHMVKLRVNEKNFQTMFATPIEIKNSKKRYTWTTCICRRGPRVILPWKAQKLFRSQ